MSSVAESLTEKKEKDAALEPIILVGNPNVGKSALFGALSGRYVEVSNYPGTTVDYSAGWVKIGRNKIRLFDSPGADSLSPVTEDEIVTRDLLLSYPDARVIESVCTFLGHPPTCPHGKRIPPGHCCKASRRQLKPIVMPLTELTVSSEARIVFITAPHRHRLGRLGNLGVVPGGNITLLQKHPSYLLRLGSTEVGIDAEIASDIYVRRIGNEVPSI